MKTLHKEPALRWHLKNNVLPRLSDKTVTNIMHICRAFNKGEIDLSCTLSGGTHVTVGEMFEDLKIEIQ